MYGGRGVQLGYLGFEGRGGIGQSGSADETLEAVWLLQSSRLGKVSIALYNGLQCA